MNYVKNLKATEPVRLYLYGLLAPVLAVLLGKGLIDGSDVALYTALGTVVLLGPATELVRSKVYAPATVEATLELVADEPTSEADLEEYEAKHSV